LTYPLSTPVTAGQPTAADHYNNLRLDALTLGQADANTVKLGAFLGKLVLGMKIEALATNRLRVAYDPNNPATVMINGYMLQATANVDLPSAQFSGTAALWYVFANRSDGSSTFTLSVNTSATPTANQRIIGTAYWDGANVTTVTSTYAGTSGLPPADYDSGWFACAYNTTYTKAHSLSAAPRLVVLLHNTASDGSGESCVVVNAKDGTALMYGLVGLDASSIYVKSGSDSAAGTITSTRRVSAAGYYKILAWK
jgi:hypothetical protein